MTKIKDNIKALKNEVLQVSSEEELVPLRKKLSMLNEKDYVHNNKGLYLLLLFLAGIIGIVFYAGVLDQPSSGGPIVLGSLAGLVVAFVWIIVDIVNKKSSEGDLEECIFDTHKLIYSNLKYPDESQVIKNKNVFSEFSRGDHSRHIYGVISGQLECDNKKIPYEYYNFKYDRVETKTRVVVTKEGTSIETYQEDVTYYRHGLFLNLNLDHTFDIDEDSFLGKDNFNSASTKFNDKFDVFTQDQFKTTKFLKPSVIVLLTDKMHLSSFTLESKKGMTLITFDDSDVLNTVYDKDDFDLFDPGTLAKLNKENLKMPKLQENLDLIKKIVNLTDKNFES